MLQNQDALAEIFAVSADLCVLGVEMPATMPELVSVSVDAGLQLECQLGLVAFDDEVGKQASQKGRCVLAGNDPTVDDAVYRVAEVGPVHVDAAAVGVGQLLNHGPMRDGYAGMNLPSDVDGVRFFPAVNTYPAFTVEQACCVCVFHEYIDDISSVNLSSEQKG